MDGRRSRGVHHLLRFGPSLIVWTADVSVEPVQGHKTILRELLKATSVYGLAGVEVALGIGSDHVQQRELSGVVPGAAEAAENLSGFMVEYPQDLIACINDVQVLLLGIRRERDIERR